jgi:tRNA(fMet)-specific endonuclease VapC
MLYLPDTNAFSRYMHGDDVALVAKFGAGFFQLRLSAVVLAVLEFGAAKSGVPRHRVRLDVLLDPLVVEPFTNADAARYGRLRADLQRAGEMIGPIDTFIAAHALRLGATVVTHNLREFHRGPGLKVEDWQTA